MNDRTEQATPFALGVTGHRLHKLNMARADHIAGEIAASLAALRGACAPRPLTCVSSLAEGADAMAADAALRLGCRLVSPLPFPADDYALDFPEGPPREAFRRLLGRAAEAWSVTPGRAALRDETEGYIAASDAMLRRSDALLAVWDGEPTELKGGAWDTMTLALARGLHVLWIDARGAAPPRCLGPADLPALRAGERPPLPGVTSFLEAALRPRPA